MQHDRTQGFQLVKKLFLICAFFVSSLTAPTTLAERTTAIFAGGCFWCMEKPFDQLEGVLETTSGYSGGHTLNPSYEQVSSGTTGHIEVLQVTYDTEKVDYLTLLKTFWRNVDPLDDGGQFCDRGEQYLSGIFVANDTQRKLAEQTQQALQKTTFKDRPIATFIRDASTFYAAEPRHQNYYKNNPLRYRFYRYNCGRDQRLDAVWKDKTLPF